MAPNIDELINRVNSLTLDKNRLKQRLVQLTQSGNCNNNNNNTNQHAPETSDQNSTHNHPTDAKPLNGSPTSKIIEGIKCSTSCEEDILYMNELYKKRLEEYNDNWDFLQSKCTALLSELNALQKRYLLLEKDKEDTERKLRDRCEDIAEVKSELQTVVVNYETQLRAMSEHLSMLATRSSKLDDGE